MEIKNNSNLSFKASVPLGLKNELCQEALKRGSKAYKAVNTQIRKVEGWGKPLSEISFLFEQKGDMFERKASLALYNNTISKNYCSPLPEKKSLYSTFMSLNQNDILKAEMNLEAKAAENLINQKNPLQTDSSEIDKLDLLW